MAFILMLLVVYCVVGSVHPAAPRIYFGPHRGDSLRHTDTFNPAITRPAQPGEAHITSFNPLLFGEHGQPTTRRHDDGVARNLDVNPGIMLPDGGSEDLGEITSTNYGGLRRVMFPSGFRGEFEPIEPASGCMVSRNLTVIHNGIPWKLLTRGQCAEKEWIVMMDGCQPGCQPQLCPLGQLEYEGQCVSPSDPSMCGEGQILYLTLRGTTYCDCEQDHFYDAWKGQCFARRQRGSCDFGEFLEINEKGNVECMPNECLIDTFEKDPASGKCYSKDFEGYCPVDALQFIKANETVGCFFLDLRNLFDRAITRSCTRGSRIDHLGDCRRELVIPSITSLPRSLSGGCRDGAIRVQSGPCRRVNSYF